MADHSPRFMTLADVADILNTPVAHVYAMVRRGEVRGIKIGGRGQWRVENVELERYIRSRYEAADRERQELSGRTADSTEPQPSDPA